MTTLDELLEMDAIAMRRSELLSSTASWACCWARPCGTPCRAHDCQVLTVRLLE